MKIDKETFKRKTFYGIPVSEILGIVIMIIPFIISIFYHGTVTKKVLLFIPWGKEKISIMPDYVAALCASAFYVSLIVRYDFFRKDDLGLSIISTVQAFLNIWVLSAWVKFVIGTGNDNVMTLLIFAVALSWLGMKTIAGYSWILFIVAAVTNMNKINKAMSGLGAWFVITLCISMLLQVSKLSDISKFLEDFKSSTKSFASSTKDEIGMATEDASERIHRVFDDAADSLRMNDLSRVAAAGEEKPRKKNKEDIE